MEQELAEARRLLEDLVDVIDQEQPDISWGFVAILDEARAFVHPDYARELRGDRDEEDQ